MLTKLAWYITSIVQYTILVIYLGGLVNIFPQNTGILFKLPVKFKLHDIYQYYIEKLHTVYLKQQKLKCLLIISVKYMR